MERRAFSVAIFARHAGQILLIKHRRLATWLPVGGEIDPGETPLEAARRELLEETGLEGRFPLTPGVHGTPPGFLGYEEHQAGSKGLHLNFVFIADVDKATIRPNEEFDEYQWVHDTGGVDCPPNVRELVVLALRAPAAS
jgi:8-oxo-dGTP pyrophosphatase MutT (NUDIX family)